MSLEQLTSTCETYIIMHVNGNMTLNLKKLDELKYDITRSWYSCGTDKTWECNFLHDAIHRLRHVMIDYQLCIKAVVKITDLERKRGYVDIVLNPTLDKMKDILKEIYQMTSNRTDGRYENVYEFLMELFACKK